METPKPKAPEQVLSLVERFERNIDTYEGDAYNETLVRVEFINPPFGQRKRERLVFVDRLIRTTAPVCWQVIRDTNPDLDRMLNHRSPSTKLRTNGGFLISMNIFRSCSQSIPNLFQQPASRAARDFGAY